MRDSFKDIVSLRSFRLADSDRDYKVKRLANERYALYVVDGEELVFVGYLTLTPYSFVIAKRVQGLMLKKEIAFEEVTLKDGVKLQELAMAMACRTGKRYAPIEARVNDKKK